MARPGRDGTSARGRLPLLLSEATTGSPGAPLPFPDRPILFFGGKGGVGKTTMAAVAALDMAARGHRTLLVSTDPAHSTADVLQTDLGDGPRRVAEGCWAMEVDPEREADRYIEAVKERVASAAPPRLLGEVYRQIDIAVSRPARSSPPSSTVSPTSSRMRGRTTTASSSIPPRRGRRCAFSPSPS